MGGTGLEPVASSVSSNSVLPIRKRGQKSVTYCGIRGYNSYKKQEDFKNPRNYCTRFRVIAVIAPSIPVLRVEYSRLAVSR